MPKDRTNPPSRTFSTRVQNTMMRFVSSLHVMIHRASGGRIGGTLVGAPVLLLTTIGRKTGKQRTTPLIYLRDGNNIVIVASKGGSPKDPVWWLNLKAAPTTTVQVGRAAIPVRAHQADAEERARLWPLLTKLYGGYADYQRRTEREIPVVVLEPIQGG